MEQYFRIALCMFLFVGYLETKSISFVCDYEDDDLSFRLLRRVNCTGVNFTSPVNMMPPCPCTAVKIVKDELKRASEQCTDTGFRINQTLIALENCSTATCPPCSREDEGPRKPFPDFVNDFESLMGMIKEYLSH